ncbi:MAG TPA: Uma2 family endonuclease, partial [Vicinamibacterales bacterium]|nr:Uma2 family endonuclease [Vicinamibacterales bacterium]
MIALSESAKYTYADLRAFPDDGKRREIIDGALYVTPSPATPHQVVVGNLYFVIRSYLATHPVGQILLAPLDVVFSQFDVVEPDLLFVSTARRRIVTSKNVAGSPDLAIEVLSPGTRRTDEGAKRRLYERFDVLEYWLVDPRLKTVKTYRRSKAEAPFERAVLYALET